MVILRRLASGGSERVVRLVVDHRPHHHSHRLQGFLENGELRKQLRRHTLAGLVSGIKIIPERLDDVIGSDPDVGCPALDDGQNGGQDATDRPDFPAVHVRRRRYGEEVPEQFIGAVDQVDIHTAPTGFFPEAMLSESQGDGEPGGPGSQRTCRVAIGDPAVAAHRFGAPGE